MELKFDAAPIVLVLSVVLFFGCSQEAAKKPDANAGVTRSVAAPPKPSPSGKSAVSSSQAPAGSSLDALRQGKRPDEGPMKNVYFEFDSYALSSDARAILKANGAWLKANPSSTVEIEGHCDERGTTEYNLALGAKRARAAMDYLATLGVNPSRMKTTSYGEELPACREALETCYEKNRRDRFVEIRSRPAF
jgi:peptidoglycan-associated lipoprotein